jgi:hypothetical protein
MKSIPTILALTISAGAAAVVVSRHSPPSRELEVKLAASEFALARLTQECEQLKAQPLGHPEWLGLDHTDSEIGREAVEHWIAKGRGGLPMLRQIATAADSPPLASRRAKDAIGAITGQWGSQTDLIWKRSVDDAINPDRPLLVLQLFGDLDEEFC